MYDRNYFRESYHEHACTIITEQDVLDIDIKGNTWLSKFRRKWYDMFLLSYSDHRARYHFTSSHAMRLERARQFRKYMSSIHPMSKFRSCWDLIMLYVIMANIVIGQSNSSIVHQETPMLLCYINVALDFIIILDLFVNIKSGYVIKMTRKVVLEPSQVLIKYCSTKIFIHAMCAIPLQSIMFLRYGKAVGYSIYKANNFTSAITFLYAIRLYRLVELSSYWTRKRNSYKATAGFRFLRIGIIFILVMLQCTYVEDVINFWQLSAGQDMPYNSLYAQSLYAQFLMHELNTPSYIYYFKAHIRRLCRCIVVFNFGLYYEFDRPHNSKIWSVVVYFICYVFYKWGVLEYLCYASLPSFQEHKKIWYHQQLLNLAKCRQIPDTVCPKISEYLEFNSSSHGITEMHNMLYKYLPRVLKNEIAFHCYNRLFKRMPFFCDWPMSVIEELVLMLHEEIHLRQYVIAEKGVQGDGLVIVDAGMIAVYSEDGVETSHLVDGDYFGELSLVSDEDVRTYCAVTLTTSKVLLLNKGDFRKFMRQHPKLFFKMKQELCQNYERSTKAALSEQLPKTT